MGHENLMLCTIFLYALQVTWLLVIEIHFIPQIIKAKDLHCSENFSSHGWLGQNNEYGTGK